MHISTVITLRNQKYCVPISYTTKKMKLKLIFSSGQCYATSVIIFNNGLAFISREYNHLCSLHGLHSKGEFQKASFTYLIGHRTKAYWRDPTYSQLYSMTTFPSCHFLIRTT